MQGLKDKKPPKSPEGGLGGALQLWKSIELK
jgi:hypothetical protein